MNDTPSPPQAGTARPVPAAALLALLLLAGCRGIERAQQRLFDDRSPRERYEDGLRLAGLGGTALVRDWLASADRALAEAPAVSAPHVEEGFLGRGEVAAFAFRLTVQRGQEVSFSLELHGDSVSQVFLDAWQVADSLGTLRQVAAADSGSRTLAMEPRRAGEYIFRAQPELLRGGRFTLDLRLAPTMAFPVQRGRNTDIGSPFGSPRDGGARSHQGVDIFARRGTPALAAGDALVRRVGESGLGGRIVWLRDRRGYSLYYAHLDSQTVYEGQRVKAGDTVGLVGNTGNARRTPPHLHFGVFRRGEGAIDPQWFVRRLDGRVPRLAADTALLGRRGVTSRTTDLLAGPVAEAAARDTLPRAGEVLVLTAVGGFYRVRLEDGRTGYVRAGRVRPMPADSGAGGLAEGSRLASRTGGVAAGSP